MKNTTLTSRYRDSKKLATGGVVPTDATKLGMSSALGLGATLGSGLIDVFGKGNTKVGGALSKGLSLGAAGFQAGGVPGAIIGGGLGLVTGFLGAGRAQKQQEAQERVMDGQAKQASLDAGQAAIAQDQSLVYGRRKSEYFANGGALGDPTKPKSAVKPVVADTLTTPRGNKIVDEDLVKFEKNTGIKWPDKKAYGEWMDKWGTPVPDKAPAKPVGSPDDKIARYNFVLHAYDKASRKDIMAGPDSVVYGRKAGEVWYPKKSLANGGSIKPYKPVAVQESTKVVTPNINPVKVRGNAIKTLKENSSPEEYRTIEQMIIANGNPTVDTLTKGTRANYSPLLNRMRVKTDNFPSNTSIIKGSPTRQDIIAELAHSKQFKDRGLIRGTLQYLEKDLPSVVLDGKESNYRVKGSIENEAHEEIEPKLRRQYQDDKRYQEGKLKKLVAAQPKMADGGSLKPMNSNAVEVKGASHANGGVQIPGAEVEGGETISNGFVYSDKLGFSDRHKPIAKALGKLEKKINNPVNAKTKELLEKKETALALQQEYYKHKNGIPSDLDNI